MGKPVTNTGGDAVLAVDLGKTSCRARVTLGATVLAEGDGAGAPGLADHDGARLSFEAIDAVLAALSRDTLERIGWIGIGAAGVEAGRAAAGELAGMLRRRFDVPVAVINDGLAAHAGAFRGDPGAILIAGTGAVVFVVTASGELRQIDGWGPWLGDDGSGQWIGRHGLRAVMRAHDGRGAQTALTGDAAAVVGAIDRLPLWVSGAGAPARQLGTFAPTVLRRAEQGDAVAVGIIAEAARLLAASCAASGADRVCVVGGLAGHPYFTDRIDAALASVGISAVAARGDARDGSALIARADDLAYEGRIIRG